MSGMFAAARHAWLQAEDLEDREEIPAYALSELNVKYIAPLRSRDEYIATVGAFPGLPV